jgi:hypothetical protein
MEYLSLPRKILHKQATTFDRTINTGKETDCNDIYISYPYLFCISPSTILNGIVISSINNELPAEPVV